MTKKLSKNPIQTATAPETTPAGIAPSTFSDGLPLPKLFVFDLDYTLWPFWVDTHVSPPLKPDSSHTSVSDRSGETFAFYRDVPGILASLKAHPQVLTGAASRTCAPDLAREMLKLLHVDYAPDEKGRDGGKKKALHAFDQMEIYPGDKKKHMRKLADGTGLDFEEMLFFDDESRNRNVEELGVTMYLVRDGVTRVEVDKGVKQWRKKRGLNGTPAVTNLEDGSGSVAPKEEL